MKNYSSRAHKGKAAYNTPSRWLAGRPEMTKRLKQNIMAVKNEFHGFKKNKKEI